jgi:hypothetical protein
MLAKFVQWYVARRELYSYRSARVETPVRAQPSASAR